METPSKQLSEIVLTKLVEAGLLRGSDKQKYLSKFAEGNITQEDWRLSIELAKAEEKNDE